MLGANPIQNQGHHNAPWFLVPLVCQQVQEEQEEQEEEQEQVQEEDALS